MIQFRYIVYDIRIIIHSISISKRDKTYLKCQKLHSNTLSKKISLKCWLQNNFQLSRIKRIHQKEFNDIHITRFQIWSQNHLKFTLRSTKVKLKFYLKSCFTSQEEFVIENPIKIEQEIDSKWSIYPKFKFLKKLKQLKSKTKN